MSSLGVETFTKNLKIILILLVATLAVSSAAILVRLSTSDEIVIAFYRLFFATLTMGILFLIFEGRDDEKKVIFSALHEKDYLIMIVSGIFLAIHFITWFMSLSYTTVTASVSLTDSSPIFVLIFSWFMLKESVKRIQIAGILLAVAGTLIITGIDFQLGGFNRVFGDFLALFSAIAVSMYFISGRHVRKRVPIFLYTTIVYGFAAVVTFVIALIMGLPLLGLPMEEYLIFLLLGILPSGVGHTLYNYALKYVKAPVVSTTTLGEVIGASILAIIILGEQSTVAIIVGALVLITGVAITLLFEETQDETT